MSKALSILILTIFSLSASQAFKIQSRIFNGIPSNRAQHPFYVFLEIDAANSNKQECGGTLVGNQFVITAAHCVDRLRDNIRLHFGVYETKNTMELGRIIMTANRENIQIHPGFSRQYMSDDVAIIKLNQSIEFSRYIQSVPFSGDCVFDEFTDGVTVGSGYQSTNGQLAEQLQWAPMHAVSKAECNAVFPFSSYRSEIFCVASEDYRSVCKVNILYNLKFFNNTIMILESGDKN